MKPAADDAKSTCATTTKTKIGTKVSPNKEAHVPYVSHVPHLKKSSGVTSPQDSVEGAS